MQQPDHAQIPPQPQGAISVNDIFSMYIALTQVPAPLHTENFTKAKNNLETIILSFTQSLTHIGANH